MKELIRERYLRQMRPFFNDHGIIKVITGIRRCGKSVLMRHISNELISYGVSYENIVYLDLDDPMNNEIKRFLNF